MSAGDYGAAFPNSRKVYVEGRCGGRHGSASRCGRSRCRAASRRCVSTTPAARATSTSVRACRCRGGDWVVGRGDVDEGPRQFVQTTWAREMPPAIAERTRMALKAAPGRA